MTRQSDEVINQSLPYGIESISGYSIQVPQFKIKTAKTSAELIDEVDWRVAREKQVHVTFTPPQNPKAAQGRIIIEFDDL